MKKLNLLLLLVSFSLIAICQKDTIICESMLMETNKITFIQKGSAIQQSIDIKKVDFVNVAEKWFVANSESIIAKNDIEFNDLDYLYLAGMELQKARNMTLTGIGLMCLGVGFAVTVQDEAGYLIGGAICLIGTIFSFSSTFNIGKAGYYLIKESESKNKSLGLLPTKTGLGLVLNF